MHLLCDHLFPNGSIEVGSKRDRIVVTGGCRQLLGGCRLRWPGTACRICWRNVVDRRRTRSELSSIAWSALQGPSHRSREGQTEATGPSVVIDRPPGALDPNRTLSASAYLTRCRLFVETNMGSLCGPGSRLGPASPRLIPADSGRSPNRAQTISPLIPAIGQRNTRFRPSVFQR